jgi:hypothetical protein
VTFFLTAMFGIGVLLIASAFDNTSLRAEVSAILTSKSIFTGSTDSTSATGSTGSTGSSGSTGQVPGVA